MAFANCCFESIFKMNILYCFDLGFIQGCSVFVRERAPGLSSNTMHRVLNFWCFYNDAIKNGLKQQLEGKYVTHRHLQG